MRPLRRGLLVGAVALGSVGAGLGPSSAAALPEPPVAVDTVISGLAYPWDVAFLPDGTMLVPERAGRLLAKPTTGPAHAVTAAMPDLFVGSESGLLGLAVDPAFAANRRIYTCQAYKGTGTGPIDLRVIRWTLSAGAGTATRQGSPVVQGLPISSGRHGGCRLRFDTDGRLHIGTGDAATGTNPQNLQSLGGKTLRVWPGGTIPADNPFVARGGNARYVWTYGHRNVQGLALQPGTGRMWSVEHGTDRDDEVNLLQRGANYGWDPVPGYDESQPMTDRTKFPAALAARWRSGNPTVATSGASFVTGSAWGRWEGALAVAELKGQGLRMMTLDPSGRIVSTEQVAALDGTVGRLRAVTSGPDGALYLTTSNGTDDRVLRLRPTARPLAYQPGRDVSPVGVSLVAVGPATTAFGRGTDGRIWFRRQPGPGAAWGAWTQVPGIVASAPSAVSWGGSRIDLFARGTNGHLLHTRTTGGAYAPWQDLGGGLTSAPAATSRGSNRLDVVARGPRDDVWRTSWDGARWSGFSSIGGVVSAAPSVAATPASGTYTVQARGASGSLCSITLGDGPAGSWTCSARRTWAGPGTGGSTAVQRVTTTVGPDGAPVVARAGQVLGMPGHLASTAAALGRPDGSYVVAGCAPSGALWLYDSRSSSYAFVSLGGRLI